MPKSTYTYSQLSSESVRRMVLSQYDLDDVLNCQFYVLGLHDNYLVETNNGKFILRIYRNNWRSYNDVAFELELLAFLGNKSDHVAKLILTKNAELAFNIDSPEGVRMAAMFHYADGYAPGIVINAEEAELLARSVASVHAISDTFIASSTRQTLDMAYLLDESVTSIKPFLNEKGFFYLCKVQEALYRSMPKLSKKECLYGICLGDVNPTNFHINNDKKITLFDFDQCGYGYRAFEIGKFFSSIHSHKEKQVIEAAFLKGYQHVRPLTETEKEAIPYFEIISVIWVMAIHVANVDRIGYKYLEKPFWDRRLTVLEELASAFIDSVR